jgi:hypothetical protein
LKISSTHDLRRTRFFDDGTVPSTHRSLYPRCAGFAVLGKPIPAGVALGIANASHTPPKRGRAGTSI